MCKLGKYVGIVDGFIRLHCTKVHESAIISFTVGLIKPYFINYFSGESVIYAVTHGCVVLFRLIQHVLILNLLDPFIACKLISI